MLSYRVAFSILSTGILLAGLPAMAQEPGTVEVVKVSKGKKLNIRTKPSLGANILGGAATGTILKSDGCEDGAEGRWCKVTLDGGVSGWSSAKYLKEGAAAAAEAPKKPAAFAIGTLKCERNNGSPAVDCSYGVLRIGAGARLQVTWPDATKRMFGIFGPAVTSKDGPVRASKLADGSYDVTLTPAGAPSEHYTVPADVIGQ